MSGPQSRPGAAPKDFHRRWPTLQPPLRPAPSVAASIATLLRDCADPLLLLGVTPELATMDRTMIALDWNPDMIALAWPGDNARRVARLADWKAMPLADASMGGALGDGPVTMLRWPQDVVAVLAELARVVRPGGRVVLRCFATPETPESLEAVCAEAVRGGLSFHAFKLRFNMACARAGGTVTIASATLYETFAAHFPDRRRLGAQAGWSLDTMAEMDAYAGSAYLHCYPKRSELAGLIGDHWPGVHSVVETFGYPAAELCPLLVLDRQ